MSSSAEAELDDSEPSTSASGDISECSRASEISTTHSSSKRCKATRKYNSSYIKWSGTEGEQRLQCMMHGEVLSNESMTPLHLKQHLTTKHTALKDKPVDFFFFFSNRREMKQSKSMIQYCVTLIVKAQEASYCASFPIVKAKKPHTIGEQLCLQLARLELTSIMCGVKAAKHLKLVPL